MTNKSSDVAQAPDKPQGIYEKFIVRRTDGQSRKCGKHYGCRYFVLDMTHDPLAVPAIRAYADACAKDNPALAGALRTWLNER